MYPLGGPFIGWTIHLDDYPLGGPYIGWTISWVDHLINGLYVGGLSFVWTI